MATMNSVQKSIHLPLTGLASPRVLMCSASVGTEGSVTLQLRDANSSDSNQSPAPTSLENALTIGYPDPEMLADVLGTLQTASLKNSNSTATTTTAITTSNSNNYISNNSAITVSHSQTSNTGSSSSNSIVNNNNGNTSSTSPTISSTAISRSNSNSTNIGTGTGTASGNKITISRRNQTAHIKDNNNKVAVQTVSTSTNTTNKTTSSYVKNCLIRSSSCSNTNNVTSLAQIMSNSSTSSSASLLNSSTNSNSNCSSNSNFSSSSNDSTISLTSNNSSGNHKNGSKNGANGSGPLKKSRPKLSSPTRHGPQQCQICSKIFGNASALAKHKLTHSDERKYVCAMCSKAFKRQDHLNGHMMTHRNKKPYECKAEGCGKSYCDARSLRRHTENHHSGIIAPQNQTLSPTAGTPTGLSLSPATASGDASSPDGATCIRTYISTGGTVVDAATGVTLTEEQIKAINLPIKTGVTLLSPTSSSSASSVGGASMPATSPTISLTETSLVEGGEGLTREQLDLISKIMQQTKQTSAQVTVSSPTSVNSYKVDTGAATSSANSPQNIANGLQSRPRTWNMQLLNTTQNVSITVDEATSDASSSTAASPIDIKDDDLNQQFVAAINPHLLNIVKIDQKPVECNLCHRKFKNIPALNGHMRLHGGYFKKDPETKKAEKKESSGPPLQTASIGVRALIEEKIISKRSKDINKGAFVVPAPPGSVASTTTIRRSISDLENFLSPKSQNGGNGSITSSSGNINAAAVSAAQTTTTLLPAATTIKSGVGGGGGGGLSIQQIGLPQSIEIFSTKQQKTVNSVSLNVGLGIGNALTANSTISPSTMKSIATTNTTTTKSTSTDPKDSTLIELLKRGTRIAVTAKKPPNSTNNISNNHNINNHHIQSGGMTSLISSRQIITNNNRTVIIPSDVQVLSSKVSKCSTSTARAATPASIALADTTPLSLTIAQSSDGTTTGDVYTVTYSGDTAGLFDDAEVYNVTDTDMLLQTVDSMQLLNDASEQLKSEHSEQQFAAVTDSSGNSCIQTEIIKLEADPSGQHIAGQIISTAAQAVGSSSTPTQSLPTFQQFHSKEIIMQNSSQVQAVTCMRANSLTLPTELKHQLGAMSSPMNSPLAYPTPPSSHENVTQSSPYVEDGHQYAETTNNFFSDKCSANFLTQGGEMTFFKATTSANNNAQQELTENEKILKLKNVLEETAFDSSIKVEDLLNGTTGDTDCDLREFAETNLSFLDEDQEFLNDSRNATSPLPESFFTSGIGTAEEVKEVLREVLPEENMTLNCDEQGENIIDLYYLPGLGLQSQMMPNSEDPLLSSSPRDFGQQRGQQQILQTAQPVQQLQQQQQQQQQQHTTQHLLYTQQLGQQQQQQLEQQQQQQHEQQQQQNELFQQQQQQSADNYAANEIVASLQTIGSTATTTNTTAPLHYNVQNLPQVQTQPQFIETTTIQHMHSLDAAMLHQPIIYTGSTDKEEIHIAAQQAGCISLMPTGNDNNGNSNTLTVRTISDALTADTNIYFTSNSSSVAPPMPATNSTANLVFASGCSSNSSRNGTATIATVTLPPMAATVISTLQPLSNQTNSILKRRLRAHNSNDSSSTHNYSKYHALSPYRSKLRKPSRTHYTPAPILNPDRKGVGLYCNVRKQLGTGLITFDAFDDDDFDDPVGLVDWSDESKVNLGSAYQAQIPPCRQRATGSCSSSGNADADGNAAVDACDSNMNYNSNSSSNADTKLDEVKETVSAEQMWDPTVQTDEKILMRYIDLSKSSAVPLGSHSEEVALQTLLKAEGNTAVAVLTLLQTQSNAFQMKWTAYELEVFLKGLEKHGKDFSRIALELGTKTTGECVQMYYFWKKLCVDYKVSHLKAETVTVIQANELKPYVCEVPDCSASFTSKAALHGHTRIHTYGRNAHNHNNHHHPTATANATASLATSSTAYATATTSASSSSACTAHSQACHSASAHQKDSSSSSSAAAAAVATTVTAAGAASKDTDYPCKVCGKVFNKVKSRSAHMKTHRVQEPADTTNNHNHNHNQSQIQNQNQTQNPSHAHSQQQNQNQSQNQSQQHSHNQMQSTQQQQQQPIQQTA